MLKKVIYSLAATLVIGVSLYADIDTAKLLSEQSPTSIQEGVLLPIPPAVESKWMMGYKVVKADASVFEWVPKNETVDNWSQLIQIQSFALDPAPSAEEFAEGFIATLKKSFPEVTSNMIQKGKDSTIFEWNLAKASQGQEAQSELVRIISTSKGIYRIAYTQKTPTLEAQTKAEWLKRLSDAKIVPIKEKLIAYPPAT